MPELSLTPLPAPLPEPSRFVDDPVLHLVVNVIAQRAAGQALSDEAVIAAHPELMPRLAEELAAADRIHQTQLAAARAGTLDQPLTPLEMSQLDAPLVPMSHDTPTHQDGSPVRIAGYRLGAEISQGGQGAVFHATQEATGRAVAIKVLNGGQFAVSASRIRFEREVALLASLNHPNIVGILDRGRTADGGFYMAMEYVDGLPLHEYFTQRKTLGLPEVLRVFIKITQALAEAHRHGIIHRDLKPANIRMDQHHEPHLLDFGLARSVSDHADAPASMPTITLPNQLVGSIPWSSPEQVLGDPIDHRSDIYSLGFMLYYVVKGAFPFPVRSLPETIESIIHARPEPLNSGLPVLDALVLRCLEKKPSNRYPSIAELLRHLEAAGERPTVPWTRVLRQWAVRAGAVVSLAALAHGGWQGAAWTFQQITHREPRVQLTNSLGMELMLIRHGTFLMGSPPKEPGHRSDEILHPVELTRDFYLARTEVTRRQYQAVMDASTVTLEEGAPEQAMGGVTKKEAEEFCRLLSRKEGRVYRLPTEAEWEYACRADTRNAFGDATPEDVGWFGLGADSPIPAVATKQPNPWGLYDMHGGVSEWCLGGYDSYSKAPVQDPKGSPVGPGVARGGSYRSSREQCRAAARLPIWDLLLHDPQIGFRVLLEVR